MSAFLVGFLIFASVSLSAFLAMKVYRLLPSQHRSAETKNVVNVAMGMVATMTALILGLLVSSAKDKYQAEDKALKEIAVKIAFIDRTLATYGEQAQPVRTALRNAIEAKLTRNLPQGGSQFAQLMPQRSTSEALYLAVKQLSPQNEAQREMKEIAIKNMYEVSQAHWMLAGQADSSVCIPLLVFVICWLVILFFSFGLFAPANGTINAAFIIAAISVASAVFLILELDTPFSGFIKISNGPLINTLKLIGS